MNKNTKRTFSKNVFKTLTLCLCFLSISISLKGQSCSVNAGISQTVCEGEELTLQGNTSGFNIDFNSIQWTLINQPTGANAFIDNTSQLISCLSGNIIPGDYEFQISADCTTGGMTTQNVIHTVSPAPTEASFSYPNVNCYEGGGISLTGVTPNPGETVSWSLINSRGTLSSSNTASNIYYPDVRDDDCIRASDYHQATIRYTITRGTCKSQYETNVRFRYAEKPFWVEKKSGPVCGLCKELFATCSLDGSGEWTYTGPGNVTFHPNAQTAWGVVACADDPGGDYTFTWTVTGGCRPGSDFTGPFSFEDYGIGTNVEISAGEDQKYCNMPASIVLDANNIPLDYTGTWSQTGGAAATIVDPNDPKTEVRGLEMGGGPYIFAWSVSGGDGCGITDTLYVYEKPEWQWSAREDYCTYTNYLVTSTSTIFETLPMDPSYFYFDTMIIKATIVDFPAQMTGIDLTKRTFKRYDYNSVQTWEDWPITNLQKGETYTWNLNKSSVNYNNWFGEDPFLGLGFGLRLSSATSVPGHYRIDLQVWDGCEWEDITYDADLGWGLNADANAGTDQILPCGIPSTQLAGNYIDNDFLNPLNPYNLGHWSFVSGPGPNPISPDEVNLTNPNIANLNQGLYTFRYTIDNALGCDDPKFDDVTILVSYTSPTGVTADINQTDFCVNGPVSLSGAIGDGGSGEWVQINPTTAATISPNANASNITLTGLLANTTYDFEWRVSNNCGTTIVPISFDVGADIGPSVAQTINEIHCVAGGNNFPLEAETPTSGTGTWSFISGPLVPTITDPNSPITTMTTGAVIPQGVFQMEWAVSNPPCGTVSKDTLLVVPGHFNNESISAGTRKDYCGVSLPFTFNMDGAVTRMSTTYGPFYQWELMTGPQTVSYSDITSTATAITVTEYGRYTFKLTGYFHENCSNQLEDIVEIVIGPEAPPAFAGEDQSRCDGSNVFTLDALTTDPSLGYGIWSVEYTNGPEVIFDDPTSPTTDVRLNGGGEVKLRWMTFPALGECLPKEDWVDISYVSPVINVADYEICDGEAGQLISDIPEPGSTVEWSQVSSFPVLIDSPNEPTTTVTGLVAGNVYEFKLTKTNGTCILEDHLMITASAPSDLPDAGLDAIQCLQWNNRDIHLNGSVPPTGVTGYWEIANRPTGSSEGTFSNINDPFATYSPADSLGKYTFRWVYDEGDCYNVDLVNITTEFCNRISGIAWDDEVEDGLRVLTEPLLEDVTIHLYREGGELEQTTYTKANGYFEFINMPENNYYLVFDESSNTASKIFSTATYCNVNDILDISDEGDSDINSYSRQTELFTLRNGFAVPHVDGGFSVSELPVELSYFQGTGNNCNIELEWETLSEENNHYFQVEHSSNGISFDVLTVIEGAGNSVEANQYHFSHKNVRQNVNYYRLLQVDFNGEYEYSTTIRVVTDCYSNDKPSIEIYPNPSLDGQVKLSYLSPTSTPIELHIYNSVGKLMDLIPLETLEGNNLFSLDFKTFEPGIYFISIKENDDFLNPIRFIKVDE